jgi:hypothetical protein
VRAADRGQPVATGACTATHHLYLAHQTAPHYTRRPMSLPYPRLAALAQVLPRLSSDGSAYVLVEAGDQSDEAPTPRTPDTECEDGRGLFLVASLCDGWGWYPAAGPADRTTRKIVWARLRLSGKDYRQDDCRRDE